MYHRNFWILCGVLQSENYKTDNLITNPSRDIKICQRQRNIEIFIKLTHESIKTNST